MDKIHTKKITKNILIISLKFYPSIGGIEQQMENLGKEFLNKGYSVDILTYKFNKKITTYESYKGLNIYRFKNDVEFFNFLIKKRKKYSLIFSRQIFRYSLFLGILKFLKILSNKTIVSLASGGINNEAVYIKNKLIIFNLYKIYFFFISQNNYINGLNSYNIESLKNILNKKYHDKIIKIYNGIQIDNLKYKKITNIKKILLLSRFQKEKGIFEVINAFKSIQNDELELYIVGDGNTKINKEVQELCENDKRIQLLGSKTGKEKEKIQKNIDLYITASYSEGFPNTILEMVKYNKPIITTDVSDLKQIFGDNLIYIKIKNEGDIKEKLIYLINNIGTYNYNYKEILKKVDIKNISKEILSLI